MSRRAHADRSVWWFDGALAVALVLLGAVEIVTGSPRPGWESAFVLFGVVPVALRRVAPVAAALAVVGVLVVASLWLGSWPDTFNVFAALLVVMFTLGELGWIAWAVAVFGLALVAVGIDPDQPVVPDLAFPAVFLAITGWAGRAVGTHRRRTAELHALTARLERERAAGARLAVLEERARLTAEIHDAVGHTVAGMLADAEAADDVLDNNPDHARVALAGVQSSGRSAIDQLRVTLRVLRSDPVDYGQAPTDDVTPVVPRRARRWPASAEVALLGALAVLCFVGIVWFPDPEDGARALSFALAALAVAGVALRSRAPVVAASLVGGVSFIDDLSGGVWFDSVPIVVAMLVILFSVGTHALTKRGLFAGLLVLCLLVADVLSGATREVMDAPFAAVLCAIPWTAGRLVRRHREQARALRGLAGELERERRANARLAVLAERTHMARELHDTVAHGVSVMVVQAAAAEQTSHRDPGAARDAIDAITRTGRAALADLQRLLGLLDVDEHRGPQTSLAELDALVADVRRAGLPVTLRVEGTPGPLPPDIAGTAYRIVQESLTNVLKHAGRPPTAVVLRYLGDALDVAIDDEGPLAEPVPNGGHGLIGMRERAALAGGEFQAGPRPAGGYGVHARLPLAGDAR